MYLEPASVAQLNALVTDDQVGIFFGGELIMKYFLRSFSPFS